ncbi:MAG TPA: TSUP family transporter, partial [Candidatus Dormibacteraeota bacterium]|nr:TSUP family transporter [Candidatus Dormibacteraeota bacterium]
MNLLLVVFGLLAVAGVVSGFLGAGGQIVGIPLLLYALPVLAGRALDPHTVTSISLAQGLGVLAGGLGHYQRRGLVDWRWALEETPPLAAGGAAGAVLSAALPGRVLLLVFAVV